MLQHERCQHNCCFNTRHVMFCHARRRMWCNTRDVLRCNKRDVLQCNARHLLCCKSCCIKLLNGIQNRTYPNARSRQTPYQGITVPCDKIQQNLLLIPVLGYSFLPIKYAWNKNQTQQLLCRHQRLPQQQCFQPPQTRSYLVLNRMVEIWSWKRMKRGARQRLPECVYSGPPSKRAAPIIAHGAVQYPRKPTIIVRAIYFFAQAY